MGSSYVPSFHLTNLFEEPSAPVQLRAPVIVNFLSMKHVIPDAVSELQCLLKRQRNNILRSKQNNFHSSAHFLFWVWALSEKSLLVHKDLVRARYVLINMQTARTGLKLTSSRTVKFYRLWWNRPWKNTKMWRTTWYWKHQVSDASLHWRFVNALFPTSNIC